MNFVTQSLFWRDVRLLPGRSLPGVPAFPRTPLPRPFEPLLPPLKPGFGPRSQGTRHFAQVVRVGPTH